MIRVSIRALVLLCSGVAVGGTTSSAATAHSSLVGPNANRVCTTLTTTVHGTKRQRQCSVNGGSQPAAPVFLSQFGTLWSAAVDTDDYVFVLDRAAELLKVSPSGHFLGRWPIPPVYVPNQPSDLTGIALGPRHTLYLTDSYNYQVVTVRDNGQIIASWDTHHVHHSRPGGPFGVAIDTHGNLYVPNFAFSEVEKYSPSGKLLKTFGHACSQVPGSENSMSACSDEGHLAPGELNHPDGVTLDRRGNLYVSDHRSRRIVKFSPNGQQVAVFGPKLPSPYGSFGLTEGVAVDAEGNIYVEDRSDPRVVKLSPSGIPIFQWQAPKGYVPEGTPGIDAEGNLYLTLNAETQPSIVLKLSPAGRVLATWK